MSVCVFGEVLFDHFPDGRKVLGGAPFNVAWHLAAFGLAPFFVSRVGADPEGGEVLGAMRTWGMDVSGVQTDPVRSTGRVTVSLDDGEPAYDIVPDVAYDAIERRSAPAPCAVLYHGSLALRQATSRAALEGLRATGTRVFLDVNLRPPWWERDDVIDLLGQADWVKLNRDELLALELGETGDDAGELLERFGLQGLILTHGAAGAELFTVDKQRLRVRPESNIPVVDTVGAGDAFASVMLLGLVNAWPPELSLQRAQAFAAGLVGNRGATVSDPGFYARYLADWQID